MGRFLTQRRACSDHGIDGDVDVDVADADVDIDVDVDVDVDLDVDIDRRLQTVDCIL